MKNGSSAIAVHQVADTENNHLTSIMNKKALLTAGSNVQQVASTMFNKLAVFGQQQQQPLNRNALGDIGNKIIPTNQLQQQKQLKPVQEVKKETKIELDDVVVVSDDDETSAMEVTNDIIDIDEFDAENTQLVSEYVKDIYAYLIHLERRFRIAPQFLETKIVTSKMRSVLIDWLIQVHLKFHLLQETLYLCVQIIDAFLQVFLNPFY